VTVLAAGAGTAYVVSAHPSARHVPAVVAATPRPPLLASLPGSAAVPSPTGLSRALATALRDPAFGGHVTADVVDGLTGEQLLDRAAATALPPASTVKVLTAAAALASLGPAARLTTGVVRDGQTLYLIGGGDVTLRASPAASPSYPAAADMTALASQTAAALGPSGGAARDVRLCLDASAYPDGPAMAPGWSAGYFTGGDIAHLSPLEVDEGAAVTHHRARAPIPRVSDPTAQAGAAFAAALRKDGVRVVVGSCRAGAPSGALGVAAVSSAPVSALVQRMLTVSDNDLAEALGRAVARRAGRPADFAGAAAAVTDQVRSLGVDTTGLVLYDASGLSRLDRVSAHTLVQVVQLAIGPGHPQLRAVAEGLPVAALTGTLADRFRQGPAATGAGVARAKTGTLAGVNTITGYVVDVDGRLLVFAFLTDRAVGPTATEAALDRLVARLATCGCG
jgi:D-alanyl-D-alanine carboxypeptidase/D-alanyl-D-alanine-endopeptidase (penicillin-binding protein 4)